MHLLVKHGKENVCVPGCFKLDVVMAKRKLLCFFTNNKHFIYIGVHSVHSEGILHIALPVVQIVNLTLI